MLLRHAGPPPLSFAALPADIATACPLLTAVDLSGHNVADLGPLVPLGGLLVLKICGTSVIDCSPLSAMTSLEHLECGGSDVDYLSWVAPLTRLATLRLIDTGLEDAELAHLAGLGSLTDLDLGSSGHIANLLHLSVLTGLQRLALDDTGIDRLNPISSLTNLQSITFQETKVWNLDPLGALVNLRSIDLGYCSRVPTLKQLSALVSLERIVACHTGISDLTPLAALTRLAYLDCSGCKRVPDLTPLAALTRLAHLDCSGCISVRTVAPLASLASSLEHLDVSRTDVSDLGTIEWASFVRLHCIKAQSSSVMDVWPLEALPVLRHFGFGVEFIPLAATRLRAAAQALEALWPWHM
jgi:Leucine-rich repeat (LRR) protein